MSKWPIVKSYAETMYTDYISPEYNLYIQQHDNGVIIISLDDTHPLITLNEQIKHIEYNEELINLKLTGKRKRGKVSITKNMKLMTIETYTNKKYEILSPLSKGYVIEINQNIKQIQNDYKNTGYLLIIESYHDINLLEQEQDIKLVKLK